MNIWTIALILVVGSIIAAFLGYTVVAWGFLAATGLVLFFYYRLTIFRFIAETKVELDKCSWPWDPNQTGFKKFRELRDSTAVVIFSVILLAGFVTTSDWLLTHLVGFITGTGLATAHSAALPVH